jgi:hypothetical protein
MDTKSPFSCSASDIAGEVSLFGILISNGIQYQINFGSMAMVVETGFYSP